MSIAMDALHDHETRWEYAGAIASGGTVFGLAISPVPEVPNIWAATGCGMFVSRDGGETWTQTLNGLTTPLLSTLAVAANGALFAGALGGDLFGSFDYGKTWEPGIIPSELRATVTTLVPSPNFRNDGSAFAATDGGGLLVSRSSGKSWEDSSFGLGDASVLALATSPDWSRRETMFAATTEGVFISMNGGRAWRETDLMLDDDAVDVLVVSPGFDRDRTVYAGTEQGALYASTNGGRRWQMLQDSIGEGPVNCLWLAPEFAQSKYMVAGIGSSIYVSSDGGETWSLAAEMTGSILTMAGDEKMLLVGLHDAGVLKSTDRGTTWASISDRLAARGFARLSGLGEKLYGMGPQEGLWISETQARTWAKVSALDAYLPLTAMASNGEGALFVASQTQGILRSADGVSQWQVVCEAEGIQALAISAEENLYWAGTTDGQLLTSNGDGSAWQVAGTPCNGQEILSIAVSPDFAQDHSLLIGTTIPATGSKQARVALWRSTNSGETWRQVTTQVTDARWIDIALPMDVKEQATDKAVLATGPYCLRPLLRAKDVWISTQVDPNGANTLSVVVTGGIDEGGLLFAATGTGVYRSIDGGRTWQPFMDGLGVGSFISIIARPEDGVQVLYALSLGGGIWKHAIV